MTYEELMRECKSVFNFDTSEQFQTVSHVLEDARKLLGNKHFYIQGAAMVAEYLANYVDEHEPSQTPDQPGL